MRSFACDKGGAVVVLFALALAPLIFMAGAALDYSGAANLKTHLQKATDGTNLALCQMPVGTAQSDLQSTANKMLTGYLGQTGYTIDSITSTTNPWTVSMTTRSLFQTAIVKAMSSNFATIPVTADAKCFGQPMTFEIALVLDNTGSMANSGGGTSKIQALRSAATNFVNYMFSDTKLGPATRMSLVPFAGAVAVDPGTYQSASWIDQNGLSPNHWAILQGGKVSAVAAGWTSRFDVFSRLATANSGWSWTGCLESLPYPLNVQDGSPSGLNPGSYYVPLLSVDESGNGGENPQSGHRDASNQTVISLNSYLDDSDGTALCPTSTDEDVRTGRACKYKSLRNPKTSNTYNPVVGPNIACTTRPLTRLTRSQTTLTSEISQLQANGGTNIHEGLMWGWRTLSPNGVFKAGTTDQTPVGYTTGSNNKYNNKIIVLMTDGENSWSTNSYNTVKSYTSAYGYISNPDDSTPANRLPPGKNNPTSATGTRAAIDQLTSEACTAIKANSVKIYTIGFSVPGDTIDSQGLALLRSCASDPSYFYVATDSNALLSVFQQIASSIGSLRLTN